MPTCILGSTRIWQDMLFDRLCLIKGLCPIWILPKHVAYTCIAAEWSVSACIFIFMDLFVSFITLALAFFKAIAFPGLHTHFAHTATHINEILNSNCIAFIV